MTDTISRPLPTMATPAPVLPRLGFLGVGWIGRHRMEAIARAGAATVAAIADPSPECREAAARAAPDALVAADLDALLALPLDGLVIATPSALHADQAIRALTRGLAVFCQKPLGRSGAESAAVVAAARAADRLLGVDFSYRHTAAMHAARERILSGDLGEVFAVDLVFHNAYGPDKPWFYDRRLSGGGAMMDLGIHLIDLARWALDAGTVGDVHARLLRGGALHDGADPHAVEDFGTASFLLDGRIEVRLTCSWRLHAGQDAEIAARFYGTRGSVAVTNVGGSFYDFTTDLWSGTSRTRLVAPPDEWGGRAAIAWAERLAAGARFDAAAEDIVAVADILDRIYAAGTVRA